MKTSYIKAALLVAAMLLVPLASHAEPAVCTDRVAETAINTVWMLLAAMLVFFMQPGFALCEAGFTRSKNTANILMKNFCDFTLGSICFWLIGFGIVFGSGGAGFAGMPNWGSLEFMTREDGLPVEGFLMFQTVFCATAATIVSGAMAERTKFSMYLAYSLLISLFIYPVQAHWSWGGGWLNDGGEGTFMHEVFGTGFHDFAGSTVVHSVGGWLALIGAWILGPRRGKYDRNGKSRAIPGHSLSLAGMGVFILWFGWFGFNPGSQLAAYGEANSIAISHTFITTNMSACTAGVSTLVVSWLRYGKPSLSLTLNGILAGLVAITAGCDLVSIGGAAAIGIVAGVVMPFAVEFVDHVLHVDDPVGASSVHGVCGVLGTILTGVFATGETDAAMTGLLYGDHSCGFLAAQVFGTLCVGLWTVAVGFVVFKGLDRIHGLRVPARIEDEGLDIYEHGETAYEHA